MGPSKKFLMLAITFLLPWTGFGYSQEEPAPAKKKVKSQAAAKALQGPEPTLANVKYGEHPRQVLDFWKAERNSPAPLVFFIHGGGWVSGDKSSARGSVARLLKEGISVVSINYRYIQQAQADGVTPPVKAPLHDAARALQFVRSKAKEWNIDSKRIGATGGSAGACSSLWLAFHDDLADPKSSDPVSRESTRLMCAAVNGAQVSLDPKQLREWMPNMVYGGHAFGFRTDGKSRKDEFERCLEQREKVLPWIKEYSPIEWVSRDDPPIFLDYPGQKDPPVVGEPQKDPTHSAVMGIKLKEKLDSVGVKCRLNYPTNPDPEFKNTLGFLIATLRSP
jgi:acetyl esterase/lipase